MNNSNLNLDEHYIKPRLVELYDLENGWDVDNDFYLSLTPDHSIQVLDLGCGTGTNALAFASQGHQVTGVDPSVPMLEIARQKPGSHRVKWANTKAQDFSSDQGFDLIIMTDHTFQVFLNKGDVRAVLAVIKRYLNPGGRMVFETRNPNQDWERLWTGIGQLKSGEGLIQVERVVSPIENQQLRFKTSYQFHIEPIETIVSKSVLQFWSLKEIKGMIAQVGLEIKELFGDWDSSVFDPDSSKEMIFTLGVKDE